MLMASVSSEEIRSQIVEAIKTVEDPEIPVNLYDLGLIYNLELTAGADSLFDVAIQMTLTTPNCPVAESMPGMVQVAVKQVGGVGAVTIDLVFNPPWSSERMSEDARLILEFMGISWKDPGGHGGGGGSGGGRATGLTVGRRKVEPRE